MSRKKYEKMKKNSFFKKVFLENAMKVLKKPSDKKQIRYEMLNLGAIVRHTDLNNEVMFCQFKVKDKMYIDWNQDAHIVKRNQEILMIDENEIINLSDTVIVPKSKNEMPKVS